MPSKKKSASGSQARSSRVTKRPPRKTTTRRARASVKHDDALELVSAEELPAESAETPSSSSQPHEVAVVGQTATSEEPLVDMPPMDMSGHVLRYPEDIPVAIISLILAGSAFLPWYKLTFIGGGKTLTTSGWATGTWGPMVAILGALSAVLAILRIAGVRVKLPYPDATIHEGVGWIALIGTVVKFRVVPKGPGGSPAMSFHWLIFIAAGAALILAMLAGRMSKISPFAAVHNWFAEKAGKIGALLLVLAVGGSVAFGMTNKVDVVKLAYGTSTSTLRGTQGVFTPKGEFPKCLSGFPHPADAAAQSGTERPTCSVSFLTKLSINDVLAFYKTAFDKSGQKYKVGSPPGGYQAMCLESPLKAVVYIVRASATANQTSVVYYATPVCPLIQPTPTKT
ncbi:MAG: hypothetical protein ACYDCC_00085 [Actinomycetota bacterium]